MESNTRVFVSGLPPKLSNAELRKHFASRFDVTDAHVIPNRSIGFVGFKDHALAKNAVDYFNRTYIRMSKISVEMARPVDTHAENSLRPKSTSNRISSRNIPNDYRIPVKRKYEPSSLADDPRLEESLEAIQTPTRSKSWADGGAVRSADLKPVNMEPPMMVPPNDHVEGVDGRKKRFKANCYSGIFSPLQINNDPAPMVDSNDKLESMVTTLECELKGTVHAHPKSAAHEIEETDEDWLLSRTSRLLGLVGYDDEAGLQTGPHRNHPVIGDESVPDAHLADTQTLNPPIQIENKLEIEEDPSDANTAMIRNTGRLFVRNLPYNTSENDLEPLFSPFGKVDELHLAFDSRSNSSKGFAYVQYIEPESAILAYKTLDGRGFQGRLLHVLPASAKKSYKLGGYDISKLPVKKQKQLKRRAEAASSYFSWNSLYMNSDAVMASVAERLGVPKSELLDPTSSDAAVKQAHAETHIIQETKAYFASNGVNLDSFKQRERGDTAILVKNFSFGVKVDDLRKLFKPYGTIFRLLMPPSGTIAIVEFSTPDEARNAFKGLAYRKLGDSILFLEKAPKGLFSNSAATAAIPEPKVVWRKFSTSDAFKAEEVEGHVETSTLFIRNLNFSTTSTRLTEVFKPLDGFLSARVKTKPDPKNPGESLSMGFGFVEFRTSSQAQAALASMDGYKLDQHELVIKESHKGMDAAERRRLEDTSKKIATRRTKVIIKNLPFQASKKDIRSLFGAYGQLRSVRVPKKFDRSARGFAFADFINAHEAKNAMDALRNSHLLGRRLVLEFASEEAIDPEEEIQKMEKKVDAQVNKVKLRQLAGSGRKRFNLVANSDEGG